MKVMVGSLLLAACGASPHVLSTPPPTSTTWTTVTLTLVGDTPTYGGSNDCVEVASKLGVRLVEGAPRAGTLTLGTNDETYLEIPGTPRYKIDAATPSGACKIALGRLVEINKLVAVGKEDPPATCELVGQVQGEDEGNLGHGSLEAATVDAQLQVRAKGGNRFVMDMGGEAKAGGGSTNVRIGGRAYHCAS